MTTLNRCLDEHLLTVTAVENPIVDTDLESVKIWLAVTEDNEGSGLPRSFGVVNREKWGFPVNEVMRAIGVSARDELVGKQIMASVIVDGGEITITNIKGAYAMQKLDVKEGKNWLQVIDCGQGRSPRSGNPYWRIKCNVLPKPGERNPATYPFGSFWVYFTQTQDWVMEILRTIATVCGAATPLDLIGGRFIADVTIRDNFVSLRNPRPYTTEEEPEPEPVGINAQSEWPW